MDGKELLGMARENDVKLRTKHEYSCGPKSVLHEEGNHYMDQITKEPIVKLSNPTYRECGLPSDDEIVASLKAGTLTESKPGTSRKQVLPGSPLSNFSSNASAGSNGGSGLAKTAKPSLDEDLRKKVETLQINDVKPVERLEDWTTGKTFEDWKDEYPIHRRSLKLMIDVFTDQMPFTSHIPPMIECNPLGMSFDDSAANVPVCFAGKKAPLNRKTKTYQRFGRRRTKSAEPDLNSYRDETPFGPRFLKHKLGSKYKHEIMPNEVSCYSKRRSVDVNGFYVVEEISEEEEEYGSNVDVSKIPKAEADSGAFYFRKNISHVVSETSASPTSSPSRQLTRIRRDLWNISPISEDFSESDKDCFEDVQDVSSTNTTCGDNSFYTRLNCSSPILAHSPSLRKTPTSTPPVATPNIKVRNFARALDDISDREEEQDTSYIPTTDMDVNQQDSDEEETESFEIDLVTGGNSSENFAALNCSFQGDRSCSSLDLELMQTSGCSNDNEEICDDAKKTAVWESLTSNVSDHIEGGNTDGFTACNTKTSAS